ncbi:DUF2252 family protein [Streptomyces humidus]|uniref:DUF2252 family protein n=1 Tax=Streptomyces humidus TaxID=52259 RepID=UPI00332F3CA3
MVRAAVQSYRERMRAFAGMGNLGVWYTRFDMDELRQQFAPMLSAGQRDRLAHTEKQARAHDTLQVFDKLTHVSS